MSISFITGKPGGGKGLLSMQQIVDELVNGQRHIICNTPVRLQPWIFGDGRPMIGLKHYLQQKYQNSFDCDARVHILDDDDVSAFFLWRVVDGKIVKAEAEIQRKNDGEERIMGFDTSLAAKSGGVLYVVDEAWKFYGSRNWQRTGEGMLFYSAQHRHFGDDVLIVTQHTKQIDPAIQRVAQDFWVVTNHSKLSIGMFRQPDIFSVAIYDQAPTGSSMSPMSRKIFKLDRAGLAQTYDTSSGVGLTGRLAADTNSRRKGLPWWGIFVVVAVCGLVLMNIPKILVWMVGRGLKKTAPKTHQVVSASQTNHSLSLPDGRQISPTNFVSVSPLSNMTETVFCCGWVDINSNTVVWLTDGRIAYSEDYEIQWIRKHSVKVFGTEYPTKLNEPQFVPSPALPEYDGVVIPRSSPSVDVTVIGQRRTPAAHVSGVQQRMNRSINASQNEGMIPAQPNY